MVILLKTVIPLLNLTKMKLVEYRPGNEGEVMAIFEYDLENGYPPDRMAVDKELLIKVIENLRKEKKDIHSLGLILQEWPE